MKTRNLILLAIVTGFFAAAAIIAVVLKQGANVAELAPQPLFPGLADRIEEIAKIRVETSLETITATRDAKGAWRLPGSGGWAANFDTARKTALALSGLRATQRRTARPQNHAALSLIAPDPENGMAKTGFRITAYDGADGVLASVIIGKISTPPDGARAGIAYVRRATEDQTYLAEGEVNFPVQVTDWIDRVLFDIAASRLMSVVVTPPAGPGYTVARANPDAEFAFTEIPRGKEPLLEDLARKIAENVALLLLDDATPASSIDFTGASHSVHRTFDGLVLSGRTVKSGNRRWTVFEAGFDAGQAAAAVKGGLIQANTGLKSEADVKQQAAQINARTKGWAFLLPGMRATDMMRDYDGLFRAKSPDQPQPPSPGSAGE